VGVRAEDWLKSVEKKLRVV
jgi:hypothetical protein